jgi:hypothetical protein
MGGSHKECYFVYVDFFFFFDKADTTTLGIMRHDPCGSFSMTRTNLSFYIITRLSSMSFGTIDNGVYLFIYFYEFVDSLASRRRKSGIIPKPRFCLFLK